jgi:uncharacterized membrane protein YjgN (DUF898 family)
MESYALLAWQNSLMEKVGVTNLPPLKGISPLRFGCAGKGLRLICSEFFFKLLGIFIFDVLAPLHFAHLDDFIASHSFYGIQYSDLPLVVQ